MWFYTKMCTSNARLDGKTVVITGASGGIGKETARDFYGRDQNKLIKTLMNISCKGDKRQSRASANKSKPSMLSEGKYYIMEFQDRKRLSDKIYYIKKTTGNTNIPNLSESPILYRRQMLHTDVREDGPKKEPKRARVILACRNMEKANEAVVDIKNNPPSRIKKDEYQNIAGELVIYSLNLASLKSVRDCAKNLLTKEAAIHILVNNAGVAMLPYEETEDGIEMTLQTNHLGHFLLTLLLIPKMQSSSPGCRIVNVSSIAYILGDINFDDINLEKSYTSIKSYAQSKLANILFTKELARRLTEANIHGINVYSLHPGLIPTEICRPVSNTLFLGISFAYNYLTWLLFKNVEQGAQTTIYCSVDEKAANETGLYYSDCQVANQRRKASNDEYAKNLWNASCKLLHLKPEEDLTTLLQTVSRQIS